MRYSSKQLIAFLLLATGLSQLEQLFPNGIYAIFAGPAAYTAAILTGSPIVSAGSDYMLLLNGFPVQVTPACSGYGFFCLMLSYMLIFQVIPLISRKKLGKGAALLAMIYPLCILTNSCRIISAYYVYQGSKLLLPANYQAAMHQGIGIIIFLSVFLLTTICVKNNLFTISTKLKLKLKQAGDYNAKQ